VSLTDAATAKVAELLAGETDGETSRSGRRPAGGCSGYSYDMFFDADVADDDIVRTFGTVKVVVDPESAELIKGATLDWSGGLQDRVSTSRIGRHANLRLRLVVQLSASPDAAPGPPRRFYRPVVRRATGSSVRARSARTAACSSAGASPTSSPGARQSRLPSRVRGFVTRRGRQDDGVLVDMGEYRGDERGLRRGLRDHLPPAPPSR